MSEAFPAFQSLKVSVESAVAFIKIAHPPINLLDAPLIRELRRCVRWLESEARVRVVVFRSADPEFFLAHADLHMIKEYGLAVPAPREGLQPFNDLCERLRRLDKLSIAQIEGRARGGGSEFALAADLRFAALGKAVFAQPEAALALMPGGGATQRLPQLLGRSRALEVLLSCEDFDAALAERYGYVNRALPAAQIAAYVRALAYRIAAFAPGVVARIKRAVDCQFEPEAGLRVEDDLFATMAREPRTQAALVAALQRGLQQRDVEMGNFLQACGIDS